MTGQKNGSFDSRYTKRVKGFSGNGLQVDGDSPVKLTEAGPYQRHLPFSLSVRVNLPKTFQRAFVLGRSRGEQDAGSRGYELLMDKGRLSFALVHFAPGDEIRIRSLQPVPVNRWLQITMTYDGSSEAGGLRLY
ncbi:MAG: hypothetical protein GTO62_05285, partial [Planctomycetales bacterium]|nr:hypothetical protein [Planctomycetales bacterium]